jgi:hypothetical protein
MRATLSILILVAIAQADRALAEAPPAALPSGPATEYVARFSERLGRETRIVYHRDGKTRIDAVRELGVESTYRDRRHGTGGTIFRTNGAGARYHMLQIRSGGEPGYSVSEAARTGQSERVLGEQCDTWSTETTSPHLQHAISTESCLTRDGIELSYRLLGSTGSVITSSQATAVERRSVDPAEVEIPREVFELGYWIGEASKATDDQRPADFETTFVWPTIKRFRPHEKVRITRRHFPWWFEQTTSGNEHGHVVHNLAAEVLFRFDEKNNGAYKHLLIARDAKPMSIDHAASLNRSEFVLGESCEWFDMHPGGMDGGLEQCRTQDGIVLKERVVVFHSGEAIAARMFQRRPIDISKVMPPPEILTSAYWGLP